MEISNFKTVSQLTEIFCCSRERVHYLLRKYKIPYRKKGRYVIVSNQNVQRMLQKQREMLVLSGQQSNRQKAGYRD